MNFWLWLPATLAATGTGLLTLSVGRWAHQIWQSISRRRLWRPLVTTNREIDGPIPPEDLFDLPPLAPWMVVGALLGLSLSSTFFYGSMRLVGVVGGLLPLLWKQQRIHEGRQAIQQQTADLVDTLRLYLGIYPTPGTALLHAIDEVQTGKLWERLRVHRDDVLVHGPDTTLNRVAEELDSTTLQHLLTRVRAANAGTTGLADALKAEAVEMAAELHRELSEQVEAAPTRLLVPMLVMLMMPLLFIVLTPPVQTLLDTLAGVGPTPLGG